MEITKIETNYKRKFFLKETKHVRYVNYSDKLENQIIRIYPNITFQTFLGFGGAFTESTGYCIKQLPLAKQEHLLNEYFSKDGLRYTLCRLPIGSSDFSLTPYSYSYQEDLSDFSIEKDKKYIIPAIKQAQKINPQIQFLSSPWSPPKFMKNNNSLFMGGKLLEKHKKTWAEYLVKYVKSYANEKIPIHYMTIQNEPNATQKWESCLYTPEEELDLLLRHIYPIFQKNHISTKLLIWDHNKEKLFTRSLAEMQSNQSLQAISGFAFHWYTGNHFENISLTNQTFPGKLLFHTEGCTGYSHFNPKDEVHNAEIYGHDILGDLNAGIHGYIDWNMVLDNKGGPNHKQNYCNSPIMLNKKHDDYIKNLTFYYIAHFSKYIQASSKRLAFTRYTDNIEVTSFQNPDGSTAIVLLNKNDFNKQYNLVVDNIVIHDNLDSHAIVTYLITSTPHS